MNKRTGDFMNLSGIVSSYSQQVIQSLPSLPSITPGKVASVAAQTFAIYAFSSMPTGDALFGAFTVCMGICLSATAGFGVMACAAACTATLAAPV